MKILITGITGSIGSEFLRYLSSIDHETKFYLIIRPTYWHTIEQRFDSLLNHWQKFNLIDSQKINFFKNNSTLLSWGELNKIGSVDLDCIFHCAADTRFDQPLEEIRKTNLGLTSRLVQIANKIENFKRFVFVSTAFAAGKRNNTVDERDKPKNWRNSYEQTKYEAEQYIINNLSADYTILRPSIVVGDSSNGYIYKFKVLYVLFRVLIAGKIPRIPLNKSANVDIVPIDYVIDSSLKLALSDKGKNQIVHITSGQHQTNVGQILSQVLKVFKLPKPKIVGAWVVYLLDSFLVRWMLPMVLKMTIKKLKHHIQYMDQKKCVFNNSKLEKLLNEEIKFIKTGFLKEIVMFCRLSSWGKRKVDCQSSRIEKSNYDYLLKGS